MSGTERIDANDTGGASMPAPGSAEPLDGLEDAFALTEPQKGMLYHALASPHSDVYVAYLSLRLRGRLDVDCLRRAWQSVFSRHQALRAAFVHDGLEEPLQLVAARVDLPWTIEPDASGDVAVTTRIARAIAAERARPLALERAPLARLRLVPLSADEHVLVWTVHHLLADGWSTPIVLEELMHCYSALIAGRTPALPPAPSFAAHVARLTRQDPAAALAHFETALRDTRPTPLVLVPPPDDGGSDAAGHAGPRVTASSVQRELARDDGAALERFCREQRLTLSTLVHGAWALVLRVWCRSDRPLFGTAVSGRASGADGIERAVGLFLNTLPLAIDIDDGRDAIEWLHDVQRRVRALAPFEHAPLAAVQAVVPRMPGEPLFESIVAIESHAHDLVLTGADGSLTIEGADYTTYSHYPLALLAMPGRRLRLALVHDRARVGSAPANEMLDAVVALLTDFVAAPARAVGEIDATVFPRVPAAAGVGRTRVSPRHATVDAWFAARAAAAPDATALIGVDRAFTAAELDGRVNRVARLVRTALENGQIAARAPAQPLVGILLPRGVDMVAALLGTLRAGAAYVPLDPDYPAARIDALIDSAGLALVLTDRTHAPSLGDSGAASLDIAAAEHLASTPLAPAPLDPGADLAYVMFTSGSTGRPKGVMIGHASLVYSTAARIAYYGEREPRFLLLSSIAFDSSVAGLYHALCGGGTLILPAPARERDLEHLAELIERHRVSHTLCLPSLYRLMLEHVPTTRLATLDTVIVAGESCPSALVREHLARRPEARLHNEYGPTEACVWSTVATLDAVPSTGTVPIGRPIGTTLVAVLDPHGRPCPSGVEGEIHIGGPGLAQGYLGLPEESAMRFPPSPLEAPPGAPPGSSTDDPDRARLYRSGDIGYRDESGVLFFVGRIDRQIKLRGHRVEPGEIEAVITAHPDVNEALIELVVPPSAAREGRGRDARVPPRLVAYCTRRQRARTDDAATSDALVTALAAHVAARLPEHLRPSAWVLLDDLPRLPNGKIDAQALPEPPARAVPPNAATRAGDRTNASEGPVDTTATARLCTLLGELLDVDDVHPEDNFFALGGDSITAIQLVSQAREIGLAIDIVAVTGADRLGDIVSAARERHATATGRAPVVAPTGATPLTPIQAWFLGVGHPVPAHWNQAGRYALAVEIDADRLEHAVRIALARHPGLGTRFARDTDRWRATVPDGTPPAETVRVLPFDDASGDAAVDIALDAAQREFALENGWMVRVLIFADTRRRARRLAWIAHHLVIDHLSVDWLLADIERACHEQAGTVTVPDARRAVSIRQWAYALAERARTLRQPGGEDPQDSSAPAGARAATIPPLVSAPASAVAVRTALTAATEEDCDELSTTLDARETASLVGDVSATRALELLLGALCAALGETFGEHRIALDVEFHGRDLLDGIDGGGTVGWFTNVCPLVVPLPAGSDGGTLIEAVGVALREARGPGRWHLTRHYLGNGAEAEPVPRPPPPSASTHPSVLFNYFGDVDARRAASALFVPLGEPPIALRSPRNLRPHAIEINAERRDGRLVLRWRCARMALDSARARRLVAATRTALLDLASGRSAGDTSGYSASDFPDSGLDDAALERFLGDLDP